MDKVILLLVVAIRLVTPVMVASVGAMFCERSGITNLGLDGMLSIGAFAAMMGSLWTGSAVAGVLFGVAGGAVIGLLHAVITIEFGGNQTISGLGINIFVGGLTAFIVRGLFNGSSISASVASLPSTGILAGIPLVGGYLAQLSPLTYVAFLMVPLAWYAMERTSIGLRIKAAGDDPATLETVGVSPWRIRYLCVILCGALAGFGGAYLSIGHMNRFVVDMVAGRGMLALVAVKMGRWQPVGILLASLFFGFFDGLQLQLQVSQALPIPPELIQTIPYLLGFAALAVFSNADIAPKAMGIPYVKNKYKI